MKILLYFLILLVMIGNVTAVAYNITRFTTNNQIENISVDSSQKSLNVSINKDATILSANVDITSFINFNTVVNYTSNYFNMSSGCLGEIGLAPNSTYSTIVCLDNGSSLSNTCITYTSGNFNKTGNLLNTSNITLSSGNYRVSINWNKIHYENMNDTNVNQQYDHGESFTNSIWDTCNTAPAVTGRDDCALTTIKKQSTTGCTYGYGCSWFSTNAQCTAITTTYTAIHTYSSTDCSSGDLNSAASGNDFQYLSQSKSSSGRSYEDFNINGTNATITCTKVGSFDWQLGTCSCSNTDLGHWYGSGCSSGTAPTTFPAVCTYAGSNTEYTGYFTLNNSGLATINSTSALLTNGTVKWNAAPLSLKIDTNNDGSIDYSNTTFNGSVVNLSLNTSALQNCVNSCTNPSGNNCICEIKFNSTVLGLLQVDLSHTITWNDTVAPTFSSNSTNNTAPKINQDVQFNITTADNVNLSSTIFSYDNGTGTFINNSPTSLSVTCYQESTNIFNQTGIDGSCGLNYNETYTYNGTWSNKNNAVDGDYSTLAFAAGTTNYFNINYSKPVNAKSALWQIKYGTVPVQNISINSSCFLQNPLRLRVYFVEVGSTQQPQCYDGSNWINFGNYLTGTNGWFYEEGIWWDISNITSFNTNITKTIQRSAGTTIQWKWYANDSSNNWNQSNTFSFIVSNTPSTFTSNNTNNTAPQQNQSVQFNITITDPDTLTGFIFAWDNGTGTFVNDSVRSLSGTSATVSINKTIDRTNGTVMQWKWYANDSAGNWNSTDNNFFSVALGNTPPQISTLNFPSNNTYINLSWINFSFSSVDLDGETITYTLYTDSQSNPTSVIYNSTNQFFNWTGLNETIYYWKVMATDPNASSANSSIFNFTVDLTLPNITIMSPVNGSTSSTKTINLNITAIDVRIDSCWFNITLQASGNLEGGTNRTLNCNTNTSFTVDLFSDYIANVFALDLAGNINVTQLYFTTSSASSSGGGGGGGGGSTETTPTQQVVTICGNNKCEEGESPNTCPTDCKVNLDSLLNGDLLQTAWFAKFVVYGFLGLIIIIIAKRTLLLDDRR